MGGFATFICHVFQMLDLLLDITRIKSPEIFLFIDALIDFLTLWARETSSNTTDT